MPRPEPPAELSAAEVGRQLEALANPAHAAVLQRFFKTGPGQYGAGDRFLGIRVPVLRAQARLNQGLSLPEISKLLRSEWHEQRLLALFMLVRQYAKADEARREAIYRLYIKNTKRINSWDLVDASAEHIVGPHLANADRDILFRFARSKLLWERRIAIMATFHYIKGREFRDTLALARLLLDDPHDLIHKAVGWMLREIGKRDRAVEEEFLRKHAPLMPRTMLRYAIEHFPEKLRRQYLAMK